MRLFFLVGACSLMISMGQAQYGYIGLDVEPADSELIESPLYHGEFNDMSGGYAVGDTVRNFIAYDPDGNPVDLYEKLAGEKPVIVANGSITCPRFRDIFNLDLNSGEYTAVRSFIAEQEDAFEWIFIYGIEAHPTAGDCPSNCPPVVTTDTAVVQATHYGERRFAVDNWLGATHFDFPFNMYADHPSNAVYNTFFERPSGWLALNCDGTVARRGDWLLFSLLNPEIQADLVAWGSGFSSCEIDWENPVIEEEEDDVVLPPLNDLGQEQWVGIASEQAAQAAMYPNPANQLVVIELERVSTVTFRDQTGRECRRVLGYQGLNSMDVSDLPSGLYFVEMEDKFLRYSQRLLIRH